MPSCMNTTSLDIVAVLSPMPPCVVGSERYAGIHPFMPHQPNSVQAFMNVTAAVRLNIAPRKMSNIECARGALGSLSAPVRSASRRA